MLSDGGALNSYLYYSEAVTSPPWGQEQEEKKIEDWRENSGMTIQLTRLLFFFQRNRLWLTYSQTSTVKLLPIRGFLTK